MGDADVPRGPPGSKRGAANANGSRPGGRSKRGAGATGSQPGGRPRPGTAGATGSQPGGRPQRGGDDGIDPAGRPGDDTPGRADVGEAVQPERVYLDDPPSIIVQQQQGGGPPGSPVKGIIALVLAFLALMTMWAILPSLMFAVGAVALGALQMQEGDGPGQTMGIIGAALGGLVILAILILLMTPVGEPVRGSGPDEPQGSSWGWWGVNHGGGSGSGGSGGSGSGGSGSGGHEEGSGGGGGGGSGSGGDTQGGGSGGGTEGGGSGGGGTEGGDGGDVDAPAPWWVVPLGCLALARRGGKRA